ncbi:hypothetical protein [Synechococcus sp. W55.1]|uniref:hypothetical protein n=1 Tax=Synechococcus sp. W55.1 TaxID=2964512 RepID=UPI0039C227A0
MDRKTVWFALKLMLAAAGISTAIKYGGPYLALPEQMPVVVGMIVLPTLIVAGLLWRWQLQSPLSKTPLPADKGSLAMENDKALTPSPSPRGEREV